MRNAHRVAGTTDFDAAGAVPDLALFGDFPETTRFASEPARQFIDRAMRQYQKCLDSRGPDGVPSHLPRTAGLLFGQSDRTETTISHIEFVPNIRDRDAGVIAEFEATIAPRFGHVYTNPGRGFWCDEKSVLQSIKRQAVHGRELLGSIHSHPDWQEIGPPHERFQELSENPTRMDEYLFRQSCWPVNVIWYVHGSGGGTAHRVAGWRPGLERCHRLDIRIPSAICTEFNVESVSSVQGEI